MPTKTVTNKSCPWLRFSWSHHFRQEHRVCERCGAEETVREKGSGHTFFPGFLDWVRTHSQCPPPAPEPSPVQQALTLAQRVQADCNRILTETRKEEKEMP